MFGLRGMGIRSRQRLMQDIHKNKGLLLIKNIFQLLNYVCALWVMGNDVCSS